MRRSSRGLAACLALGIGLVQGAVPAPGRSEARPAGPVSLVLGPEGHLYSWRAGTPGLGPLPATLGQIDRTTVNDMAVSEDGRSFLVLPAVTPASGPGGKPQKASRRSRAEGLAILVYSPDPSGPPRIVSEFRFDGEGRRAVLSPDGTRAFVVSARAAAEATPGQSRTWVHELDLDTGKVAASDHIEAPPAALAIDPAGTRLYLAYPGRIVSYTTRPLAVSWHYRSPGGNRAIGFRPGSPVLYALRKQEITLFDPDIMAARSPEDRRKTEDEATGVIPVPFDAGTLTFSRGGRVAAVHGDGNSLAFIDLEAGRVLTSVGTPALNGESRSIRPIAFEDGDGNLLVATFPKGTVVAVSAPETPPIPEPTPAPSPTPSPSPTPGPFPSPTPTPTPRPFPSPAPTPTPPLPGPTPPDPGPEPTPGPPPPMPTPTPNPFPTPAPRPPEASSGLAGRISGMTELVVAVVIYGPDSIIKESARAAPQKDGSWSVPLPPPGSYRVVPVGQGTRPLRCEPHFQTIQVANEALGGLDFRILGTD